MSEGQVEGTRQSELREVDRSNGSGHTSNVHRLPFEVLAHMFEFYVDNDEEDNGFLGPKGVFPLGAMCQSWRHTAWTTPSLWITLRFRLGPKTTESNVQLTIGGFSRSGELPLSVYLSNKGSQETTILPLIDLVNQLLYRCRILVLFGFTFLTHSRFSPSQRPSILQLLRVLPQQFTSPLNLGPQVAPKELCIDDLRLGLLVINWNNLITLEAIDLYLNDLFLAITLAPQLVSCTLFDVKGDTPLPPNGYKSIVHPQIKDLTICLHYDHNGDVIVTFFQAISLRNLTECHVNANDYPFPSSAFLPFLSRSSCSIQKLDICAESIQGEDLMEIAKASPCITTLTLNLAEGMSMQPTLDPFYNALCQDSRYAAHGHTVHTVLLPLLRHLDIYTDRTFPWELLPGFRSEYLHEGSTPCRLNLESIKIRLRYGAHNPKNMISSWESFCELLELRDHVELNLKLGDIDLFECSYRWLQGGSEKFVSKQVDEFAKNIASAVDNRSGE